MAQYVEGCQVKTIALISQKGGSGKSTLTVNLACLAAEAGPAMLIDRDTAQGTTLKWWKRRQEAEPAPEMPDLLELGTSPLAAAVEQLRAEAGTLFIDTRPSVAQPEADSARLSDLVIVPVKTSINDVEAVVDTISMLKRLDRPYVVVVSAARNERRANDARAFLSRFGATVCPHSIGDRTVYADAALMGSSVLEMQGTAARTAEAELRKVWQWISEFGHG